MDIREITSKDTLSLRNEVLRPGKDVSTCIFEGDDAPNTRHFGAIDEAGSIVGVVSVYRKSNTAIKAENSYQIRAMATGSACRGKGVGRLLLAAVEEHANSEGSSLIWANARSSAVGFYTKAGYRVASSEFNIDGIGPHYLVVKLCGPDGNSVASIYGGIICQRI